MQPRNLRTLAFSFIAALGLLATVATADTYKVDPVHSSVVFRIKHLGVSWVYGRFNDIAGTLNADDADPTKTSFDVDVKTDSVDTHSDARDKHLRSGDFFDAKQFPDITFKSTSAKKTGDDTLEVTGDLTLHGITKSVTVTLTHVGTGKGMQGETRTGYAGELDLKRTDYDMKTMVGPVGDDVHMFINVEAIKQ